jgi:hypothetical protein
VGDFFKRNEFLNRNHSTYLREENLLDALYIEEKEDNSSLEFIPYFDRYYQTAEPKYTYTNLKDVQLNKDFISFQNIKIKVRGDSSRILIKKQYSISLHQPLFGEKNWVLNGSVLDKSCLRNYMAYNIGSKFFTTFNSPDNLHFINLYINNEYQGLYTMIPDKKKFLISSLTSLDIELNHFSSFENTSNYNKYKDVYYNYKANGNVEPYVVNSHQSLNLPLNISIQNFIQTLLEEIYSGNFDRLDLPSFVDFVLLQEMLKNTDGLVKSVALNYDLVEENLKFLTFGIMIVLPVFVDITHV